MGQVAGARERGGGRKVASVGGEPGGAEEKGDARDPAEINQGILRSFLPLRSRLNGVGGGEGASFSAECITGRRAAIKLSRAIPRVSARFTSRDRRRRRPAADARGRGGYPRGSPRSLRGSGSTTGLAFRSLSERVAARGDPCVPEGSRKRGRKEAAALLAPRHGARTRTREPGELAHARHSTRGLLMSASQSGNFSTSRRVMHEPRGGEQAILPDQSR